MPSRSIMQKLAQKVLPCSGLPWIDVPYLGRQFHRSVFDEHELIGHAR
jgi:hypothetical protein